MNDFDNFIKSLCTILLMIRIKLRKKHGLLAFADALACSADYGSTADAGLSLRKIGDEARDI